MGSETVIFFNGCPGAGKDTAVAHAQNEILSATTKHLKMADPLYAAIRELFGLERHEWSHLYQTAKNDPSGLLRGMTPRQTMIWLSEEVMKPKFGNDFFGLIAARNTIAFFDSIQEDGIVLFSDSGFVSEVRSVVSMIGNNNCYLIRLHSSEDSFSGDSRSLIDASDVGIDKSNFYTIYNTGSLYEFKTNVGLVVSMIEKKSHEHWRNQW